MTEPVRADLGSSGNGFHVQISKLLVVAIIAATAATGALVIVTLVAMPGPPPGPGPNGLPPPPPDLRPLAVFPIITGLFVLAWLAVIVVFSRDQILLRIQEAGRGASTDPAAARREMHDLFTALRGELAEDRERDLHLLEERLASLTSDYGEQRETDGYLHGLRVATAPDDAGADVHSIRRTYPRR
jgi:hypothetical protein